MKRAEEKKIVLREIKRHNNLTTAADRAGVSRMSVYRWLDSDDKFKRALETAKNEFRQRDD